MGRTNASVPTWGVKNAALNGARENSVVPPGLESFLLLVPALKRWAKVGRPSGAGFADISFQYVAQNSFGRALLGWDGRMRPSLRGVSGGFGVAWTFFEGDIYLVA